MNEQQLWMINYTTSSGCIDIYLAANNLDEALEMFVSIYPEGEDHFGHETKKHMINLIKGVGSVHFKNQQ